jgi:hypothetical protein
VADRWRVWACVARRDARMIARFLRRDWLAPDEERARARRLEREYADGGRQGPPPHVVKQAAVRAAGRSTAGGILVETGTLHGDMVAAMLPFFDDIYSIELSRELHLLARLRFLGRRRVHLILGDSAEQLPLLLPRLDRPCVFWLDGHYGGGCMARGAKDVPIVEELEAILAHPVAGHVILIDDVGIFARAEGDTPSLADLETLVRASNPSCGWSVADNMIRVTLH